MVAEAKLWGDVDGTVRSWARSALPQFNGRVFFAANNKAPFPQLVLWRISGRDEEALIQFDVWEHNKAQASALAAAVATAVDSVAGYLVNGVQLKSARVEEINWIPDEEGDDPRYVVQATFSAWAVPAPSQ
jgi:Protein of unknown function (DUF3168)